MVRAFQSRCQMGVCALFCAALLAPSLAFAGIVFPPPQLPPKYKHALLVGINEYRATGMNLMGAVNDVLAMKQVLEDHGFSVELLLNANATKKAVLQSFGEHLGRHKDKRDIFVFHFSGHGNPGGLVTHEYSKKEKDDLDENDFGVLIDKVPEDRGDQRVMFLDTQAWKFASLASRKFIVGIAANAGEGAIEVGKPVPMGAFTYGLVQALYDAGQRSWTWRQLVQRITKHVQEVSNRRQTPQFVGRLTQPVFGGAWSPTHARFVVEPTRPGRTQIVIRAGTLRGLEAGATLAIYKNASDWEPLGEVEVQTAGLIESRCPVGIRRGDAPGKDPKKLIAALRNGGFAARVSGQLKPVILRIQLDAPALKEKLAELKYVKVVTSDKFDLRITPTVDSSKRFIVYRGNRVAVPKTLTGDEVVRWVKAEYLRRALDDLRNPDPLSRLDVELKVHRVDVTAAGTIDRDYGPIVDIKGRSPRIRAGTRVQLRVTNNSKSKAWFTIVRAGNREAEIQYPSPAEEGRNYVWAGKTKSLAPYEMTNEGPHVFKLIATAKQGQSVRGVGEDGKRLLKNLLSFVVKRQNRGVDFDYQSGQRWGTDDYRFEVRGSVTKAASKPGTIAAEPGEGGPKYRPDPRITILEPAVVDNKPVVINTKSVRIRGKITANALIHELKINGEDVTPLPDNSFETTINLVWGQNTVTVEVSSPEKKAHTQKITIVRPQLTRRGKDYALFIALQKYKPKHGWAVLNNPIPDARAIQKVLVEDYGFVSTKDDLLENPTRGQIIKKLREWVQRSKSFSADDQLLIYVTGHGAYDETTEVGYTAMLNAKAGDPGFDGYLSHGDLETYFKAIKAQHKLLILDVCYGGSFDQNKIELQKGPDDSVEVLSKDEYIRNKLKMPSAEFLTSAELQKVSDGQPGQHSPFAREILKALRKENRRYDLLTFPRLYDEISHIKPGPHRGDLYNTSGDFIFIQQ